MKTILIVFALLFSGLSVGEINASDAITSKMEYRCMVVIKVKDMNLDKHNAISKVVSRDAKSSIEYACLWSGVVVIKLTNASISEKGDAEIYIQNHILREAKVSGVEVLDIHIAPESGSGKC